MTQVTAAQVKELREKSGAGMMDCKTALTETGGDVESAIDWLRKKGMAAAAKKAGRTAAEGLVAVAADGRRGVAVELNSETDFVARNSDFQAFVGEIAQVALATGGNLDSLMDASANSGKPVREAVAEMIGMIGENLTLRRSAGLSVEEGCVASYVHNAVAPGSGMGRIAVLVALESGGNGEILREIGRKLAMHVAAASPRWISRDDVASADIEREREILAEQARSTGKPDNIVEKMVEGRLRKFYEEFCLLDQTYSIDGESRVSAVLDAAAKEAGAPVRIAGFVRFQLGEDVKKKETDFAAEVAATKADR